MHPRIFTFFLAVLIPNVASTSLAQQHSQRPQLHSGAPESKLGSLDKRYLKYACAIVHLSNDLGSGTGFFVDDKGTIATATHVLYKTVYAGTQLAPVITLEHPQTPVQITGFDGKIFIYEYPSELTRADYTRATADLTLINSGQASKCFLPLSKRKEETVGEHIIAIGFPGFADNQVLYEGFLSSTGKALPFPVGQIGGKPVYPQYRLLRVQMPITPGASGGPLIDDRGEVLGVISQEPVVWMSDLEALVKTYGQNASGSGVYLSGFDVTKLLAQLAFVVHEFETPGSGLAIPASYFEPPTSANLGR